MSQSGPKSPAEVPDESGYISAARLADRLGRSRWWVGDQARRELIPHVRLGPDPEPGKRDVRPIVFTPEMADVIERRVKHVEYVPEAESA